MKICHDCKKDYPDDLIRPMTVGNAEGVHHYYICPECALVRMRKIHDMPSLTFMATTTLDLYDRAVEYNRLRGEKKFK